MIRQGREGGKISPLLLFDPWERKKFITHQTIAVLSKIHFLNQVPKSSRGFLKIALRRVRGFLLLKPRGVKGAFNYFLVDVVCSTLKKSLFGIQNQTRNAPPFKDTNRKIRKTEYIYICGSKNGYSCSAINTGEV